MRYEAEVRHDRRYLRRAPFRHRRLLFPHNAAVRRQQHPAHCVQHPDGLCLRAGGGQSGKEVRLCVCLPALRAGSGVFAAWRAGAACGQRAQLPGLHRADAREHARPAGRTLARRGGCAAVEGEKAGGGVFRLCCAVLCCQALPRFPPLGDQSRDSGLLLLAVRDDRVHAGELSRGRVQL